jgi:glyoxylase-like metal-dependent hydrolase (beta-lactamase superfamily II)
MNKKSISHAGHLSYPHNVTQERLEGTYTTLTNFFFRYGANIYVFTYEKNGKKLHTFIDSGYAAHHHKIFPILKKNGIDLKNIENIIITHRHPDHSGLAGLLAAESGATVLAHKNFKDFVEGNISAAEKMWLGALDTSSLKKCNVEYLHCNNGNGAFTISGVDFPRTGKTVEIGENCRLEILACPESSPTHSPDQLILLYSPRRTPFACGKTDEAFRPFDEMIFAGDLWLMKGPIFEKNLRSLKLSMKFLLYRGMASVLRRNEIRRLPREQDAKAKDALKQGFCLIRVKPGHGDEFLGSNIIPKSILADRDLLIKFGFSMDENKSVLLSEALAPQIAGLREKAYVDFADILGLWMETGYSPDEIPGLLARIYMEQNGGGPLVEEDRKERRKRLKDMLIRLVSEKNESDDLHRIAKSTLPRLNAHN